MADSIFFPYLSELLKLWLHIRPSGQFFQVVIYVWDLISGGAFLQEPQSDLRGTYGG